MKRIISIFLILAMIFLFVACNKKGQTGDSENHGRNNGNSDTPTSATIVIPEYKDYGRGSVDFKDLTYSRPNLDAVIMAFNAVTGTVKANNVSLSEQIDAIKDLEELYKHAESMYTLTEIFTHSDSSVEFWQNEFTYISTGYPAFTKAVEDLLVACACSEHRSNFESDYFGYSLEEYADGGMYTDALVELLEEEATLEAEYTSLSTDNVVITYKSVDGSTYNGTVNEILVILAEKYGKDTQEYKNATIVVDDLYNQRLVTLNTDIYLRLLKTRRLIADELGYESYTDFAYKDIGYDYTKEDMKQLLDDIGNYISPIQHELNSVTFSTYFKKNNQPKLDKVTMINTLYKAYSKGNADFKDAYSYMLQHGLYNISPSYPNRYSGAFTAYIDSNNSPYIFATTSGFLKDYNSISHEFGHFYDGFVNNGADISLDLAEVSSQAMQLLTLLMLRNELKLNEYEYLEYLTMYNMLEDTLLKQSFYAEFEHLVYQLEFDEITLKNVNEAVLNAYTAIYGGELTAMSPVQYVLILHVILRPHYVESYVASSIPALEIFSMESYRTGTRGSGIEAYKNLIERSDTTLSFTAALAEAGLSSPFETTTVKKIANCIYFQILGKNYYQEAKIKSNAA